MEDDCLGEKIPRPLLPQSILHLFTNIDSQYTNIAVNTLKVKIEKCHLYVVQCPHSKEEDSVATICGFEDEFQYLKV